MYFLSGFICSQQSCTTIGVTGQSSSTLEIAYVYWFLTGGTKPLMNKKMTFRTNNHPFSTFRKVSCIRASYLLYPSTVLNVCWLMRNVPIRPLNSNSGQTRRSPVHTWCAWIQKVSLLGLPNLLAMIRTGPLHFSYFSMSMANTFKPLHPRHRISFRFWTLSFFCWLMRKAFL